MKFITIVWILLTVVSVHAGTDNPVSDFMCHPYIISRGATKSEVLNKCGRPSNIETWQQERIIRDFYRAIPAPSDEQLSQQPLFLKEYIRVEEWEYNLGPTRFIYYLRFENGTLKRITVGSYGY
jgi:hypothetical protein